MLRISDCGLRIGPNRRDSAIRNRQSAIRFDRMNATPRIPVPVNEPVLSYAPGSPERAELKRTVKDLSSRQIEIPLVIGGKEVRTGKTVDVVMPHCHRHVLAKVHQAGAAEVEAAIAAARAAWREWATWGLEQRAAVFLKAADLLATRYRPIVNAATMLGQSKRAHQAEIDAACELIDFFRFNVHYAERRYTQQPLATPGAWNSIAYRAFAGIHFTGSTEVFQALWQQVSANLTSYAGYPRLVGETGGKDFIVAHSSADVDALATALVRGAYEYQGQKCSAASRAYVPDGLWARLRARVLEMLAEVKVGDPADFRNFMGAVIDRKAFDKIRGYLEAAQRAPGVTLLFGGGASDADGYFIEPTLIQTEDPRYRTMCEEIFGPVLSLYVYPEARWTETLHLVDETSPYALTGAIFAQDRRAVTEAQSALRFAAGNFYVNDKPTGAVVGQQPFGGARASGTDDKAGSLLNLIRWVSPQAVKETFVPPRSFSYPFMAES